MFSKELSSEGVYGQISSGIPELIFLTKDSMGSHSQNILHVALFRCGSSLLQDSCVISPINAQ